MPGNLHVRFEEGRVGRHFAARPLSYSTLPLSSSLVSTCVGRAAHLETDSSGRFRAANIGSAFGQVSGAYRDISGTVEPVNF